MGFLANLGRFILFFALAALGGLLLQDKDAQSIFDKNYKNLVSLCNCVACQQFLLSWTLYVKYAIVGLLFSTVLNLLFNSSCVLFLNFLGLCSYTAIMTNPFIEKDEAQKQIIFSQFLQNVSIAGGLLYLIGYSCQDKCCFNKKVEVKDQKPQAEEQELDTKEKQKPKQNKPDEKKKNKKD